MKRNALVSILTVGSLLAVLPGPAGAATFVVTNVNDAGPGSFRDAIAQANAANGNDAINFDPAVFGSPQSIQLNGFLSIDPANGPDALEITGPGADLLTVRAAVAGGAALDVPDGNNIIRGITFQGTTTPQFLATVNNNTDLTLDAVVIMGNTSDAAGAGSGGGLINFNGGNLTLLNSSVTNNTVINNGPGGGGGGIVNVGAMSVRNATISGNEVRGAGANGGGGIYNVGNLQLLNATVSGNTVEHGGGGIRVDPGQVRLANTILALNTGDLGNDIVGTNYTSQGHNLIGTTTGGTIAATNGDLFGTSASMINPMLGTLGDNGGTTPTLALLDGSVAIDAGDPNNSDAAIPAPRALVPSPTTDQRGVTRPQDGGNDIGAFEVVPNRFDFGKVDLNKKNGTATLAVTVFTAGELALAGSGIKPQRAVRGRRAHAKPVPAAGTYKLKVKATGGKKKKLNKKGKVKVKAKVTFTPTDGTPNTETKKVTLKRKG